MINRNGHLVQFTNSFIMNITRWGKDNYSLNSRNALKYGFLALATAIVAFAVSTIPFVSASPPNYHTLVCMW